MTRAADSAILNKPPPFDVPSQLRPLAAGEADPYTWPRIRALLRELLVQQHPEKHGLGRAWFGIVMGVLGSLALAFGIVVTLMPKLIPR